MTDKTKITLIYSSVAVLCILFISGFIFLGKLYDIKAEADKPLAVDIGKETFDELLQLQEDITLTNQDGQTVSISDLKDKVWVFAQFFAKCPMCAERNYSDLMKIYKQYKGNPDFMIVCMSVDPEADDVAKLKEYAASVKADTSNWWFLTGDRAEMHAYMSGEMKFLDIRERTDELEIARKGRYAHDLGVAVFDQDLKMRVKVDLAFARSQSHELLKTYEEKLHGAINLSLNN